MDYKRMTIIKTHTFSRSTNRAEQVLLVEL